MMTTSLIYNFGQTVLDSSKQTAKKKVAVEQSKDPEENQIIEQYEGECEKCEQIKPQKACPVCGV